MAMYHFRIKSDKKPNGTKISAVKHVEYINREGTFAHDEYWKQNNKFVGNFISTEKMPNAFDGLNALLYKTDDFGSIRNSKRGIEVTENFSHTTITIALMLANKALNHQPLIINGSPDFYKALLQVALENNLSISFQDKLLQGTFELRKREKEIERRNFLANGGIIISKRQKTQSRIHPARAKTIEEATQTGFHLPSLSQLPSLKGTSEGIQLTEGEARELDEIMREQYQHVRYDFSDEQKSFAQMTAKKILENVQEALKQKSTVSHAEYINREKAYEKRGGCIFQFHRLPKWAKNDPKKFFQAADKYEGVGHRRYVEIEFALPNELKTVEQYRQIIDAFIAKHLSDHYFAYAIHNKTGMMSDGQHHPHVHIMFSERLIDDVEKKKERAAKAFFLYPARKKKDGSESSFEEKWKRGAPKDRKWCNRQYISEMRADFAQIQNAVLEQNGFSIRVDHRSLQAQKEEAEQNGDTFLARPFSRIPEEYVGVISCKENDDEKVERLKEFRSLRNQHFDLVMKIDTIAKETEELETKDAIQIASTAAKSLMDSKEFAVQKFASQPLLAMREKMLTAVAEVNKWKRVIISQHDAEEQAKLEYMSKPEQELWQKYFETLAQKKHLEEFLQTLQKPDEKYKEEVKAYEELVRGVNSKIFSLLTSARAMKKSVEDIKHRLEQPEYRNNILMVTHQILQANTHARKMLKRASEELDKAVDDLRNALFAKTIQEPQTSFKTREVYDLIRQQYRALKKEHEDLFVDKFHLQRQIISPKRAIFMAKNIFVHGDFKRLREKIRRYKKEEQKLAPKLLAYAKEEKEFQRRDWSVFPRSTFLQVQYYLTKQRTLLELERSRLDQIKFSLQSKQAELEALCRQPDAAKKIEIIAIGILRKNYKFVRQLEEVDNRDKEIILRMNHAKEQMNALKNLIARDKVNTRYRITICDKLTKNQVASLIADAILMEPQAVQLVARFDGIIWKWKKIGSL